MTDKPRLTSKIYLWWNDNGRFKIQTIILFAMFLITHILFLWAPVFAADEEDVTLGGKAIARGISALQGLYLATYAGDLLHKCAL
ncbi:MAG: hypothetical protein LKM40_04980 [Mageeibacillus sp.]|jgi:hypothetical protein|nr:hypothetical protein [Mageeibacillus sp.]